MTHHNKTVVRQKNYCNNQQFIDVYSTNKIKKPIWFHIIAISFNIDIIAFSDSCQIIYTDSPNITYLFIERYQW